MSNQSELPENFDFIYDFCLENFDEIEKLTEQEKKICLYWLKKFSDFQVNYSS